MFLDTINILAFSDWRSQPIKDIFSVVENIEKPVDLIVYSGDDVCRFVEGDRNYFTELAEKTKLRKVLAVVGNDDPPIESKKILTAKNVHDLDESPFLHKGFAFIGLDGLGLRNRMRTDESFELKAQTKLENQLSQCTDSNLIIVSHLPPYGILDHAKRWGREHIGSKSLLEFIKKNRFKVTICGHCHLYGGQKENFEGGVVVNIASHDDKGAEGKYAKIRIDKYDSLTKVSINSTRELWTADTEPLLYLSQFGPRRLKHFKEAGIATLEQVGEDNRELMIGLPGASDWHVNRWIEESEAILKNNTYIRNQQELSYLKNENIVFLDIETDLAQTTIFLIGLYSSKTNDYTQLFEKDEEIKLLSSFMTYLEELNNPLIIYYGGNQFDENCIIRCFKKYKLTRGVEMMNNCYDLGIFLQQNLVGKFEGYKLDYIAEKLSGFKYSSQISGIDVGLAYDKYLDEGIEPDWDKFLDYNLEDVKALKSVVEFMVD